MATLNISTELLQTLQKLAEAEQLSVNELAENILTRYTHQQATDSEEDDGIYRPDPQELAELLDSMAESEAEEAAGVEITLEEAMQTLKQRIANHRLQQNNKASA